MLRGYQERVTAMDLRKRAGEDHPLWKGGRGVTGCGYIRVNDGPNNRKFEHHMIIERVLGKPIPKGAIPHHVDGDKTNNKNSNLVLCNDRGYHNLIHRRINAYMACGHYDWLKCSCCGKYDDPQNMYVQQKSGNRTTARHVECHREYMRKYHKKHGW